METFKISWRKPGRRSLGLRKLRHCADAFLLLLLAACGGGAVDKSAPVNSLAPSPEPVDGLTGKVFAGYQGWFGCPGDDGVNQRWYRWFRDTPLAGRLMVDLVPSAHGMAAADLCDTGLLNADGSAFHVFSAQNANVVRTHFRWMRDHGIDGAAFQRFVLELDDPVEKRRRDRVLANVRDAAELNGRTFYVTFDVSGLGENRTEVVSKLRDDWRHLVGDLHVTSSPAYARSHGKPVLELWGFGFSDRAGEPAEVAELIADLKGGNDGMEAAFVIGGVPSQWRTLRGSSKTDAAWAQVYRSYDVISPWSVGRFVDDAGADAYLHSVIIPDLAETERLGIGYMPVTFPGFSWRNQMINKALPGIAILNQIPRRCGDFLWHQYANYLGAGVQSVYAAMFDEFDEGTALAPAATTILEVPLGIPLVTLDQEGCDVPDDWYLRITGAASGYLKNGETPPAQIPTTL